MVDKLLLVDLGLRNTGYCIASLRRTGRPPAGPRVFMQPGLIQTVKRASPNGSPKVLADMRDAGHLSFIFRQVADALDDAKQLHGIIVEPPTGSGKSARSLFLMGVAVGAFGVAMDPYPPSCLEVVLGVDIKKAALGKDRTKYSAVESKRRVAAIVRATFDFPEDIMAGYNKAKSEHIYDAAATLLAARDSELVKELGWPPEVFEPRRAIE